MNLQLPTLKESTKNKITMVGLALIFAPFAFIGLANAYDSFILSQLENALNNNIQSAQTSAQACESTYQALLKYKQENKIALTGAGSPCPFHQAK